MNKKYTYICDFETGKTENDVCFVWLWCAVSLDGQHKTHGYDIASFMEWLSKKRCKVPFTIYFHNLKYDGTYIMSWLLSNGFQYTNEKNMQPGQFNSVIANGSWYSFSVRFANCTISFRDSLKLLNMPVSAIGKLVGTDKGDLGEHYNITKEDYIATEDDITYCYKDCDIVRKGLIAMFDMNINKLTIASSSYKDCMKGYKPKDWQTLFPDIGDIVDENIRHAYVGGWCYVAPEITGKIVGNGGVIDVNSLYPSVLYYKRLPYGMPKRCTTEHLLPHHVAIYKIRLTCKLKENYLPTIMCKTHKFSKKVDYITSCKDYEMWLTNIDLDLIKNHYKCKYQIIDGYMFDTLAPEDSPLHSYIGKWMKVKEQATIDGNKVMRQIAKIMMNSIYGKYGSRRTGHQQIPYINNHGALSLYTSPVVESLKIYYLPLAIFCTAYAREKTITTAQQIHSIGKFCYSDTDSIHFEKLTKTDLIEMGIDIHPTRLGAWDYEKSFDKAKFLRQKCYIEETDNELDVKICGCPKELNHIPLNKLVTFDSFEEGMTLTGKLAQKSLTGGTYLYETTFTLK